MRTFYSILDEPGHGGTSYLFERTYGLKHVPYANKADIIIWNGGEDVGTEIYGEEPVTRYIPLRKSERDVFEIDIFNNFRNDSSKLLLGICRGAQLLNCLNGGKLYQDVNNHGMSHDMKDIQTGETLRVTSTHHQQMRPGAGAVIIGVSHQSTYKNCGTGIESYKHGEVDDMEILWYPATRSLCIQGHPEYIPNSRFADYTWELIKRLTKESELSAAS